MDVNMAFLVELDDWEVAPVTWMAPLCQYHILKDAKAFEPARMRHRALLHEVEGCRWMPLKEWAARHAFGKLPETTLRALAPILACHDDLGEDLFSVCMSLVRSTLKCSEEEAMTILQKRCFPTTAQQQEKLLANSDDILEAVAVKDRDTSNSEIKKAKANKHETNLFRTKWSTKRREAHPAAAKASAKAKGKAKGRGRGGRGKGHPPTPRPVPDHVPSQSSLREWLPEHAHIWRANTVHRWIGRL